MNEFYISLIRHGLVFVSGAIWPFSRTIFSVFLEEEDEVYFHTLSSPNHRDLLCAGLPGCVKFPGNAFIFSDHQDHGRVALSQYCPQPRVYRNTCGLSTFFNDYCQCYLYSQMGALWNAVVFSMRCVD